MKVLITGGAGFIGSHLAEALLERGDEVYVLDDLSTGSIENIEALKGARGFHYTIDTVMNEPSTAELVDRVDVVVHLAAAVGVRLIVESRARHGDAPEAREQEEEAAPAGFDFRGVRQEHGGPLPRGFGSGSRSPHQGPLELRLLQGHR
jgi:uncharacterized protein YbjT (DUF2867 family)